MTRAAGLFIAAVPLLLAVAQPATGGTREHKWLLAAKGCYWHLGERYCSRYCYVEIDGQRYCQYREDKATPQGDPFAAERPDLDRLYRERARR